MSLALDLQVDGNAGPQLGRWRILMTLAGLGALGYAGFDLSQGLEQRAIPALLALAGIAALLWPVPRWNVRSGTLQVAGDGAPRWVAGESGDGEPMQLRCWQFGASIAWLELRTAGGATLRLALARRSFSAGQWAALGRWLTWQQRGQNGARA